MRDRSSIAAKSRLDLFLAIIRADVAARRHRGLRHAFWAVGQHFGVRERRVRAAWLGQVSQVAASELAQVQARLRPALIEREQALERQINALRQEIQALDGGPDGIDPAMDGVARAIAGASPAGAWPLVDRRRASAAGG